MKNANIVKIINSFKSFFYNEYDIQTRECIKKQSFFSLLLLLLLLLPMYGLHIDFGLFILSWIGNITFLYSVYLYYINTKTLISPYLFFYTSFYIFHFGQFLLYSLGFKYDFVHLGYYKIYWNNDNDILINGIKLIIFSLSMFNLGALLSFRNRKEKKKWINPNDKIMEIKLIGWILFGVTAIPYYINKVNQVMISIQHGYQGLYNASIETISKPSILNILFIPSCLLLLVSYESKKINYSFQGILVFTGLLGLLGGGRTESMGIFVMLFLYNVIKSGGINFKKGLISTGVVYVLLLILSSFSDFRLIENKSLIKFVQIVSQNIFSENLLTKIIGEMGWSMGTVFMTIYIVPKEIPFALGATYLASLSRLFPTSLDPTGVLNKLHTVSASPSNLVTNFFNTNFGMDSTLVAESYYNWGYFGIIPILLIGIIMGMILGYKSEDNIADKRFSFYTKLIGSYVLFTLPRRHFGYLVNQFSYTILLVYILIVVLFVFNSKVRVYRL